MFYPSAIRSFPVFLWFFIGMPAQRQVSGAVRAFSPVLRAFDLPSIFTRSPSTLVRLLPLQMPRAYPSLFQSCHFFHRIQNGMIFNHLIEFCQIIDHQDIFLDRLRLAANKIIRRSGRRSQIVDAMFAHFLTQPDRLRRGSQLDADDLLRIVEYHRSGSG